MKLIMAILVTMFLLLFPTLSVVTFFKHSDILVFSLSLSLFAATIVGLYHYGIARVSSTPKEEKNNIIRGVR